MDDTKVTACIKKNKKTTLAEKQCHAVKIKAENTFPINSIEKFNKLK